MTNLWLEIALSQKKYGCLTAWIKKNLAWQLKAAAWGLGMGPYAK